MANAVGSDALSQLIELFQKKNAANSASPQAQAKVMPGQGQAQAQTRQGQFPINQNLLNYSTPSTQKIGASRPGMDLSQVINFISQNRQPLTVPFAPGTKTLQSRQFDESTKQNEIANQLSQAKFNLSTANADSGGSAPKLTVTQQKNDLLGSMTNYVKEKALAGTSYNEAVNIIWDNMDEVDRQTLSLSDVQSQVKRIYELNGVDIENMGSGNGNSTGNIFTDGSSGSSNIGSNMSNYSLPSVPYDPNLQGNFASPFDRVAVGKTPRLANFPWYVR